MSGSAFWRKDRSCYVFKYIGPDGEWAQKLCPREYTKSQKRAAIAWAEDWLVAERARGGAPVRRVEGLTLAQASERWLKLVATDDTYSPATVKSYTTDMQSQILNEAELAPGERIAHEPLASLANDAARLKAWYLAVRRRAKSVYRARDVFSTLRLFFDECLLQKWIRGSNPLRDRALAKKLLPELPTKREAPVVFVPLAHAQALIAHPLVVVPRRVRYCVAFTTGAREGELAGLTWGDVDLDAAVPVWNVEKAFRLVRGEGETLGPTKTRTSQRTLPLHPAAIEALRWWRDDPLGWAFYLTRRPRKSDPVFPSQKRVERADVEHARPASAAIIRRDLEALGLPSAGAKGRPITAHSTRKSFLTFLERAGVAEHHRKTLAGHGNSDVGERFYVDRLVEELAAAVARIPLSWEAPDADAPSHGSGRGAKRGAGGTKEASQTAGRAVETSTKALVAQWIEQRFPNSSRDGASERHATPNARPVTRSRPKVNAQRDTNAFEKSPGFFPGTTQPKVPGRIDPRSVPHAQFLDLGLRRSTLTLPDGTTVGTDVEPGEPLERVTARLLVGLQQKGVAAFETEDGIGGLPEGTTLGDAFR